jgi:hypothetical protein
MDWKFQRDRACITDAFPGARGQLQQMAVARG